MAQAVQVFEAPGHPDEPLPVMRPPWTIDRLVYIPLWDWYLIVDEAAKRDTEWGRLLAVSSGSADPAVSDAIQLDHGDAVRLIEFMERMAREYSAGVDLTKEQAERELGDYDSTVYAQMLLAVAEVMREALRRGEPFKAWNE